MTITSLLFFPFLHFHPIFLLVSLFLYFLPAFLARNKPNFTGVLLLNIFAGWTFIGWIIALIWALNAQEQGHVVAPLQPATAGTRQPTTGETFFCSVCGKPVASNARFCSSCGAVVPAPQR